MTQLVTALALATLGVHPVEAAHADAAKVPAELRQYVRYLRFDDLLAKDRGEAIKVVSAHCNQLSTTSELVPLAVVPGTDETLCRLNLKDYGWSHDLWEQLQSPYDHTTIEETTDWIYDHQDQQTGKWSKKTQKLKGKKTVAVAPWLTDTPALAKLAGELTTMLDTRGPIIRARWFFSQTAAAADRKPNYYDFLGVKDEKGFQQLVGFDAKLDKRRVEVRESVALSGVTLQPRAIVRRDSVGGSYWYTLDFKRALDKLNPLRVLGTDIEEAFRSKDVATEVASEQYGTLPNGMWATGLFNGAGARADSAPDFIASDSASKSNDKRVHVNVSCLRCHDNGGLKDIDGWARAVFAPPFELKSPDYDLFRQLRQQYLRKLEPFIARDRVQYTEAVKELTGWDWNTKEYGAGWTTKEYAAKYSALWEGYEDAQVDLVRAARDLNTTPGTLTKAIQRQAKIGGIVDPALSALLVKRTIPIRQWEELQPLAHQILRGVSVP